jgi:propionyl-CoA synthetase
MHVLSGRGSQTALIYDSPLLTGTMQGNDPYIRHISYNELLDEINACSKMLLDLGVKKGDRIFIYMPMIPEAIISMLSIARIGAVHSVVFGGFAPPELAKRIADAKPKVIISASCGIEPKKLISYGPMLHEAIDVSKHRPYACIEFDRGVKHLQGQIFRADLASSCDVVVDWDQVMDSLRQQKPKVLPVSVRSEDPLYILYTSGTTGKPKGIVRDNGGHAVALKWTMKNIYNALPGDVFFAASDIGWVVGHSYICYGPLLQGCTTVLFEGKPVGAPEPSAFWRVVSTHKVKTSLQLLRQLEL